MSITQAQFNAAVSRSNKSRVREDVPLMSRYAMAKFLSDGNIEPLNQALAAIQHVAGVRVARRLFELGNGQQGSDKGLVPFEIADGFARGKINKERRDWLLGEAGESGQSRAVAKLEANIAKWLESLDGSDANKAKAEWELAKWAKAQAKVLEKHGVDIKTATAALRKAS